MKRIQFNAAPFSHFHFNFISVLYLFLQFKENFPYFLLFSFASINICFSESLTSFDEFWYCFDVNSPPPDSMLLFEVEYFHTNHGWLGSSKLTRIVNCQSHNKYTFVRVSEQAKKSETPDHFPLTLKWVWPCWPPMPLRYLFNSIQISITALKPNNRHIERQNVC